jgi:pilus assembly protein CpaE
VIFLDFSDPRRATAVAAELDRCYPMVATVALHAARQPQDLLELMQLGIREVIKTPVERSAVAPAFARAIRKLSTASPDDDCGSLYAFLPAKPGVGATTLAANASAAAARMGNQRVLLLDLDFRLGMTSFLFKLDGKYSVLDAVAPFVKLDIDLWDQMVCRRGSLDVLGSAPVEFKSVDPERGAVALVDFALRSYQTICADLPGEMREYEIDVLHRAKECFLVTTPDIGSLHMARRKVELLQSVGLHAKTSVIMNRVTGRGSMPVRDVEEILQLPVRFSVSAADREVAMATQTGRPVEGRSAFAREIENIARRMAPGVGSQPVGGAKARRFIEMFSVSRVRNRAGWGW